MKTGFSLLCCLLAAVVLAETPRLPEIQTPETLRFHGRVHKVTQTTALCQQKEGQWIPGEPTATQSWEFDDAGRLLRSTYNNREYKYEYDAAGRLVKESWGNLTGTAGGNDVSRPQFGQTTYTYDAQGRVTRVDIRTALRYQDGAGLAFTSNISEYAYDAQGHMIEWKVTEDDAHQRITRFSYDEQGREVGRVTTDEKGDVLSQQSAVYLEAGGKIVTGTGLTERYDAEGRLLESVAIYPDSALERRDTWRYTERGKEQHYIEQQHGKTLLMQDRYYRGNQLLAYMKSDEKGFATDNSWVYNSHGDLAAYFSGRSEFRILDIPDRSSMLLNYTYDARDNWTAKMEFRFVFDQRGNPVFENDQPKMQCTKMTREITYFEK